MARYHVDHRYSSSTFGPWAEGDHVELSEEDAAWVNHDSEGTLTLVDPQEQARAKREAQEAAERKRLADKEPPAETSPEKPASRTRRAAGSTAKAGGTSGTSASGRASTPRRSGSSGTTKK